MNDAHGISTGQQLDVAPYWRGAERGDEPIWKRGGPTKKGLLKKYRNCVETSKKWRKDEQIDDTWRRLGKLYQGKHFADGLVTEDRIAVNVSFATVNVIVPSIAVNFPHISVNARQQLAVPAAEVTEAYVNYWWRKYEWRKEIKRAVKDSLVYGPGWVKVGWRYKEESRPVTEDEYMESFEQAREQAGQAAEQNPEMAAELPTDEDIQDSLPTEVSEPVVDRPFVERVSPYDIFVDPEATCMEDLKWIAQRLVVPLEDVRKDPKYNSKARKDVKADAGTNPRWRHEEDGNTYDDSTKRCTIFEFYEVEKGYYCVFAAAGGEDFLVDPTDMPYPYGHPFHLLPNYEVPDQFYPLGDLQMLEPMQSELNAVRSDMRNHRKRWQRAYLARRRVFDPEAQATLESDEDNRVVYVDTDDDLSSLVVPIQQIPLDAQMYDYSAQIESDIDLVSGVSEYQRGAMSETRRTATEASIIQDAANARAADKLASVELFIREIAECVVQLAQTYLTGEQVARVVQNGEQMWIPFDRDSIQGEFDFEVEAGSTQPRNEAFRRQQAVQLMSTIGPFIGTVIDPFKMAQHVLKEGFDIKNPEEFMIDPMMAMMAEQQQAEDEEASKDKESERRQNEAQAKQPPTTGEQAAMPQSGPNMNPQLLAQAQLEGQMGLQLPNTGV